LFAFGITTDGGAKAGTDYVAVAPTQIAFTTGQTITLARVLINGDVLNNINLGYAVAMGMVGVMAITILIYLWLQRRAARWQR